MLVQLLAFAFCLLSATTIAKPIIDDYEMALVAPMIYVTDVMNAATVEMQTTTADWIDLMISKLVLRVDYRQQDYVYSAMWCSVGGRQYHNSEQTLRIQYRCDRDKLENMQVGSQAALQLFKDDNGQRQALTSTTFAFIVAHSRPIARATF